MTRLRPITDRAFITVAVAAAASLVFAAGASAAFVTYQFANKPIPDGHGAAKLKFNIDLPDPAVTDVDALLRVKHRKTQQLSMALKGPDGTKVKLSKHDTHGRHLGKKRCLAHPMSSTEFPDFMAFDDEGDDPVSAGSAPYASGRSPPYPFPSFQPRQPLSAFDGSSGDGTWKLTVKDTKPGAAGMFRCGRLAFND